MMNNFSKRMRTLLGSQLGLAMDEMILVVTMLVGVGGFTVVSISWNSVLGTEPAFVQFAREASQIEKANHEFYSAYGMWPHQATNGLWEHNMAVLKTSSVMRPGLRSHVIYHNLLPQYELDTKSGTIQHDIGKGGSILQRAVEEGRNTYLEVIFKNIPYETAREVDEDIDGRYDPQNGKVRLIFEGDQINLHYRANRINGRSA